MIPRKSFVIIILVLLAAMLLFFITSCYTEQKAKNQFAKASLSYPIIPAEYCAVTFPPKDKVVKGDSIKVTDTLYIPDGVVTDTVKTLDTIRITTTQIKTKVVTNTIHVTDTIYKTNVAELKACEIYKNNLIEQLNKQTIKSDKFEAKAKKRGIIMWALIFILVGIVGYKVYSFIKPTPKT